MKPASILPLIAAAMCCGAMLPGMPYGYFMLVRWTVCAVGLWCAKEVWERLKNQGLAWSCVAVAVLFNPLIKIHLTRDLWWFVDGGAAAFLGLIAYRLQVNR